MDPPERTHSGVAFASTHLKPNWQKRHGRVYLATLAGREHLFQGDRQLIFQGSALELNLGFPGPCLAIDFRTNLMRTILFRKTKWHFSQRAV